MIDIVQKVRLLQTRNEHNLRKKNTSLKNVTYVQQMYKKMFWKVTEGS